MQEVSTLTTRSGYLVRHTLMAERTCRSVTTQLVSSWVAIPSKTSLRPMEVRQQFLLAVSMAPGFMAPPLSLPAA